jgi:hypothetical protein
MTGLPESVHRLTEPWTLVLTPKEAGTYRAQDFPPLMVMLAGLVTPNAGRTRGGVNDPSTRSVLDVKALDLLMHIQDVTRSRLTLWGVRVSKDDTVDVRAFHNRLETLRSSGGIREDEYHHLSAYFQRWADSIWDLVEPPLQVPLRDATCPVCGRAKWVNENDEWVDALLVSYRDGGDVQATCRWNSCPFVAVGPRALLELGFHVGASSDEDALRSMGVIT